MWILSFFQDMMNREKKDQLPAMQIAFIDSICVPVYEAFANLSPKLKPLLDGVNTNRQHWRKIIASSSASSSQTNPEAEYNGPSH